MITIATDAGRADRMVEVTRNWRLDRARTSVLFVVYVATAKLGLALEPASGFATLVWAPTGIALFALLRFGIRLWPAITLGAAVVNVWTGAPVAVALGIAVGNTLEATVAALALRRLGFERRLERIVDVVRLLLVASIASTTLKANRYLRACYSFNRSWWSSPCPCCCSVRQSPNGDARTKSRSKRSGCARSFFLSRVMSFERRWLRKSSLERHSARGWRAHRRGGLGLGLYITRQAIEAHGGSIRVESEVG